jgi:putative salt-induced outer membrane protein YdiY
MMRSLAICGCFFGLLSAGIVRAQDLPFAAPRPMGGPITMPNGRIASGLDINGPKSPWSGALELGLSGSDGNTEVFKVRVGADVKYDTPDDVFTLNAFYGRSQQNNVLNENKALLTARNELPVDEMFSWFSQVQLEFDDFRAITSRVALHSGVSIIALKNEQQTLKFRLGAGASREFGAGAGWLPEGQIGAEWERKITERTKFVLGADYFPDMGDWTRYRIRGRASFDILLDEELNLALRLGAQERYDSQPGPNTKKNDLDYFATLLFKF